MNEGVTRKAHIFWWLKLLFMAILFACSLGVDCQVTDEGKPVKVNPYFTRTTSTVDGEIVGKVIISGPPEPRAGFARTAAALPEPNVAAGINTLSGVPAFTWCFGCSATSAAMIAGYYDRTGYSNMYTGPTNGGVMPLDNSSWGTWLDSCSAYRAQCPLSATRNGLDGRTTKGHVDDYWVCYGNTGPDPFSGNWTEHTLGDCTADFMRTNQAAYGNTDASTSFWFHPGGEKWTYNWDRDGGYGFELFLESRGYTVVERYSRILLGYDWDGSGTGYSPATQGATFADYKAEIDAGRPVMVHLEGHTIVGVGYDDSTNTMYIHDTWDHLTHTMTWGGTYGGMLHFGITVVRLAPTGPEIDVQRPAGHSISNGGTDDVGTQSVGVPATIVYTVVNTGGGSLSVSGVTASNPSHCGGFVVNTPMPLSVPPGSSRTLSISITPSAASFSFDMDIANTDSGKNPYDIAVVGTLPPNIAASPASFACSVAPDASSSLALSIGNTGGRDLTWTVSVSNAVSPAAPKLPKAAGGPDTYGYTWKDSNEAGGPTYSWVDITGSGTPLGLGDDAASSAIPLPFSFSFYGEEKTSVYIGSNGYLSFDPDPTTHYNRAIPLSGSTDDFVAPFWDDLDPSAGGQVYYLAEANRFVVSWVLVPFYAYSSYHLTFQAILYPNGRVLLQYLNMTGDGALQSATTGIENGTGTDGLEIAYNEAYVASGLAVEITPPATWIEITPTGGTTPISGMSPVSVNLDAAGLSAGDVCTCDIVIASNDPDTPLVTVPLTMHVTLPGTAAVFRVTSAGEVFGDGAFYGTAFLSGSADVAEWVSVSGPVEPGTVLELDPEQPGAYRPSQAACSLLVGGVVSSEPGMVLGGTESAEGYALLALSGIVPVKVTHEGGPIRPGDLLVSSSTPGYAMRWASEEPRPCAVVGKALEPMTDERGVISVLLTSH